MKVATIVLVFLGFAGIVSRADASTLTLVVDNGILIGANNVNVNGTLYDVVFEDGTCAALFNGCDATSDFATAGIAFAAAEALDEQVFIDSVDGNFDSNPSLTRGCTTLVVVECFALVPNTVGQGPGPGLFDVSGNTAANQVSGANTVGIFGPQSSLFDTSGTTGQAASFTYAVFTPVQPVPEPASMLLFGSGFGAAIVRLRRRKASAA
jgi:PEP-CTERM motif